MRNFYFLFVRVEAESYSFLDIRDYATAELPRATYAYAPRDMGPGRRLDIRIPSWVGLRHRVKRKMQTNPKDET
jgi:hypothetical protein